MAHSRKADPFFVLVVASPSCAKRSPPPIWVAAHFTGSLSPSAFSSICRRVLLPMARLRLHLIFFYSAPNKLLYCSLMSDVPDDPTAISPFLQKVCPRAGKQFVTRP